MKTSTKIETSGTLIGLALIIAGSFTDIVLVILGLTIAVYSQGLSMGVWMHKKGKIKE